MLFRNDVKRLNKKIAPVLALENKYKNYSDDELKAETTRFKQLLASGKTLKDIYPEAFAVAKEATRRVTGLDLYNEQLMGGYVLYEGDVAEMKTGEGKTLTAIAPTYLVALEGKGVHVVTVNEYLAQRDAQETGRVLEWLGLTVGVNLQSMAMEQKKKAHACDVTYTTNSELGFDYLRDNMVRNTEYRVLRGLNFALVDEADSVLIDDARTPLIISGPRALSSTLYKDADSFVKRLVNNKDYIIDERTKTVQLTEDGMAKAADFWKVKSLYSPENAEKLHYISNALRANYILLKDVDYIVKNKEIYIVDPSTGRIMEGRQWSDGIHQAVEAKEKCAIQPETVTMATITYQNFFRLFDKLAGMTGTAKTEEEEFLEIYNMRVVEIPTHKPVIRQDITDEIYGTKRAKYNAIVKEVKERHDKGQPILLGTPSVEISELLSDMLDKARVPHVVLNAKNNEKEAEIVAHAGQKDAVTIATNMAGRGTDIKLGEGVKELGGLCVIGTERHEARRIDNQLRGRAGRQGDPGVSKFFVSAQDDIMVRFGSERMEKVFTSFGDEKIESKSIAKSITNAQKRVEGVNYDARKHLLKYDDVMGKQRETMYQQRNYILDHDNVHDMILNLMQKAVEGCLITDEKGRLDEALSNNFLKSIGIEKKVDTKLSVKDNLAEIFAFAKNAYERKIEDSSIDFSALERNALLGIFDFVWSRHIDTMDKLKQGIGLRGYAQSDPLQSYITESYELFDDMTLQIAKEITGWCLLYKIQQNNN